MRKKVRVHDLKIVYLAWCLSFFLSLCMGSGALAESTRPCADEIATFCKDVKPGAGRLLTCIQEHEEDLSPTCRKKLEEAKQRLKEAQEACGKDVEKFCQDVRPGAGRIAKCLRGHMNELSPACRQKTQRAEKTRREKKDTAQ